MNEYFILTKSLKELAGYRVGSHTLEGWAWIVGASFFALWVGWEIILAIGNYSPPEAAAPQRSQTDVLEDILKELKK
jgi:hypothetical protein